jgi:hypothetical protein
MLASAVVSVLVSSPALAGPPLVCFPFEIGNARTLPMGGNGWHSVDPAYDVTRLVDDTLTLLQPETPVLVRMETLRRATIYVASDSVRATALLNALKERASVPQAKVGLNVFRLRLPGRDLPAGTADLRGRDTGDRWHRRLSARAESPRAARRSGDAVCGCGDN